MAVQSGRCYLYPNVKDEKTEVKLFFLKIYNKNLKIAYIKIFAFLSIAHTLGNRYLDSLP